jgi:tetratricopeptide (TPR) repeat protein
MPDYMSQGLYLEMAELYAQQNVKPDAALKLTDETERSLEPMRRTDNDEVVSQVESQIAETRAQIYLDMRMYEPALTQAQKAMTKFGKSAQAHLILAQAYAGHGDNAKALEEYFNAALVPSNKDLEYRAELQRFYLAHFGNEKQFEAALHKQIADRFQAANYVPKLLEQPAPKFEFTTLKGEKFDSANLIGKIVVMNFWSPG